MVVIIIMLISSCKKTEIPFLGKWELTETYDGYEFGNKSWTSQPTDAHRILHFIDDHNYTDTESGNSGHIGTCVGTYIYNPKDNSLIRHSNCYVGDERLSVSEVNADILILKVQVIEGAILYKFKAVK